MEKKCNKCNNILHVSNFSKNCRKKDGYDIYCKNCSIERLKYYRLKEKVISKFKICNNCKIEQSYKNFHKNNASKDGLRHICKNCRRNINKEWNKLNKEKIKIYNTEYRLNNKTNLKIYWNNYIKNRKRKDILFKLRFNITSLIKESFKNKGFLKNTKAITILGCSWESFKNHLENNEFGFKVGDKELDLDHIIPISDAKSEDELIKLSHYSNFQLLPSYYNRYVKKTKEFNREELIEYLK